ncbi:MAG: Uma2 family endonuclease [Clostridiaceae bacterium]|jgi:Uma2 family endonuclease|nr:Uma2 family endonuclease [Clostridiaceae bacterium]
MANNLAYQEDFEQKRRREIIDGQLVMMSPRPSVNHNRVVGNISWIFQNYLRGRKCEPFSDGVDLFLDEKNQFVPDFMVVCDPEKIHPDGVHGAPDLVVEVLSPSTAKSDKTIKKEVYAKCGVKEYWLADPSGKSLEVYRAKGTEFVLHDLYALHEDWELAQMTEEERAAVPTQFQCSLFHDLDILIADIFYRTF